MVLGWFFKSRKAITALLVIVAALVIVGIGVAQDDADLIRDGLLVAAGTAVSLILAVAYEDGARVKVTEEAEQQLLGAVERTLRSFGLDEAVIAAIRSLADSAIVTDEEEGQAAWPKGGKGGGPEGGSVPAQDTAF